MILCMFYTPLRNWILERQDGGGATVQIADAAGHPDGLSARGYLDPAPPSRDLAYRLRIERSENGRSVFLRSAWIPIAAPATPRRSIFPQPWDGTGEIQLPGQVRDGETVDLFGPDGGLITFDIDPFRKHCLLNGLDNIGLTMEKHEHIQTFEDKASIAKPWH